MNIARQMKQCLFPSLGTGHSFDTLIGLLVVRKRKSYCCNCNIKQVGSGFR